jgi:hypothetical protein
MSYVLVAATGVGNFVDSDHGEGGLSAAMGSGLRSGRNIADCTNLLTREL